MKRLSLAVRVVVAALALMQAIPAQAAELVVSTNDLSVQVSGPWQTASSPDGANYLFRASGGGSSTVFWPFPSSMDPGQYEVFANWVSGQDRATDATYFVASGDGKQTVSENQQSNGGSWQSLGTFSFQPRKGQGVTLTDSASGMVVAGSVRWMSAANGASAAVPASQSAAPASTPTPAPAAAQAQPPQGGPSTDPSAIWTVAMNATDLHAGPDAATDTLARVPQFSYLQILGYQGDWAYVYNPRAHGTAYALSNILGPTDPPPAWVSAPPPASAGSIEMMGRTVGSAPVAYYPVDDKFAYTKSLGHNAPILVHDKVQGADGSTWYRVDGGYLAAKSIRLPRPPTKNYTGRWLDADLQEPAMLTAYDGNKLVMDTLAIKGNVANQTPTGTFTILRRVQDETMDSGTLSPPIDPHGPGGYHLEHVLNTQYFTSDGASIHYNYWSSNFGYSGSHGCLGLDLQDSQFLWNWADVGTTVVIRS